MGACPHCGVENREGARFCDSCGAALAGSQAAREERKTVTVVFCDVSGSTQLGEKLDPESLRRVMARYFEAMKAVIERHGGTVEKFIGDAVMAVFGVPVLHEDDALRAVRAAAQMGVALAGLNEEFGRDYGTRLELRIGVNTGEVVVGTEERLATGDAVNVAARLEQAAAPGEILLGKETFTLVRDLVSAEPVEPFTAKGKAEPVAAWRLSALLADVPAFTRPIGAPFVGRDPELTMLLAAFARAVAGSCQLSTVVGPPGIGKSRLAREFIGSVADGARVLVGRCLPYGEGITFWPLAEMVKQLAGDDVHAAIAGILADDPDAELVARLVAGAVGVSAGEVQAEETFWAIRKLFESLAREQPLIAVIDDIHWAEPTLLDLIEYITAFAGDAPILLLCLARPDLFDERASWAAPRTNTLLLTLEPLAVDEAEALIDRLLQSQTLAPRLRARIVDAAEGNPLFVEQILAMRAEQPDAVGEIDLPPTLEALLAARIDRLTPEERAVLQRAAIEGRGFHRGAVFELLPVEARAAVSGRLISLVRKEFVRPDRSLFAGDDGFRFSHILVRDAAYQSTSKQLRAELHKRYADWLERQAGLRVSEYEEILGHHLEQAHRYRVELGPVDAAGRAIAKQAAARLQSAGQRAFARGDMPAAGNLLERAADLLPEDDPVRLELLPDLAGALVEVGELERADAILGETVAAASAVGNERLEWRARLGRAAVKVWLGSSFEQSVAVAEEAVGVFGRLGDELGLARASNLIALSRFWLGSSAAAEEGWHRALEHAGRARSPREEAQALSWLLVSAWVGPTPVEAGILRCREILERSPSRQVEAFALLEQGPLLAMRGDFPQARELFRRGKEILDDLGLAIHSAGSSQEAFDIEMLAGDPAAAEVELRQACEILERLGEKGFLSTRAGLLAHALCAQGRYQEAEPFIQVAAEAGSEDDRATQTLWRSARAKVLASRGDFGEALRLAREAFAILEPTDWLNLRGDALINLAETLRLADRSNEAAPLLEEAVILYEQKGNIVAAAKARAVLEEMRADVAYPR